MRRLPVMLGIIAAVSVIGSGGAKAQNYPWCANYGGFFGDGGTNCGFTTYEQCLATISGMGGACERNLQYVPPPGPHDSPVYRPHHRRHRLPR
jgi:hypothetical protein